MFVDKTLRLSEREEKRGGGEAGEERKFKEQPLSRGFTKESPVSQSRGDIRSAIAGLD
jgi:hypothetical protein